MAQTDLEKLVRENKLLKGGGLALHQSTAHVV
jgi:hypothetical protein